MGKIIRWMLKHVRPLIRMRPNQEWDADISASNLLRHPIDSAKDIKDKATIGIQLTFKF